MTTQHEQELELHLKHAKGAFEGLQGQVAALRNELYLAGERVRAAEQSRDTIRAHAQAALDKYRAQDKELERYREMFEVQYALVGDSSGSQASIFFENEDDAQEFTRVLDRGSYYNNRYEFHILPFED